jgi:hypothetical protein
MHLCFKIVKFLLQSMSLYMFRTILCPSSGAFHHCTGSLWLPCDFVLVASSSTVLLILIQPSSWFLFNFMNDDVRNHEREVLESCKCLRILINVIIEFKRTSHNSEKKIILKGYEYCSDT